MDFFKDFTRGEANIGTSSGKNLKKKNQMKKELSACVMQKFNGYELLRNHPNSRERKNFIPIDVVYEPTLNKKKTIEYFFAPKIYLRADFE